MYNRYVRDENGNYRRISVEEPIDIGHGDRAELTIDIAEKPPLPPPEPHHEERHEEHRRENHHHEPPQERPPRPPAPEPPPHRPPPGTPPPFSLGPLLQQMEDVDSGDLLLLFLLLMLFQKGADEELVIALGLLLIL